MEKKMMRITLILLVLFISLFIFQRGNDAPMILSMLITTGTVLYHFGMRLLVGTSIDHILHNNADITKPYWHIRNWERKLYRHLHVREWKGRMPTYNPVLFDMKTKTLNEIAMASAEAETVHTVNAILSFLPLSASILFGAFPVFLITSIIAAIIDLMFVIMQRFNRDRIFTLLNHHK